MSEDVRLILGDALEVMRGMADGSVDAVVTDPPYGTDSPGDGYGRRSLGGPLKRIAGDADLSALEAALPLCRRVLRPHSWCCLFCSPKRRDAVGAVLRGAGARVVGEVVWDKASAGLGGGIRYQHETVLLCAFGSPVGRSELFSVHREFFRGATSHPHEKPVSLLRKLVRYVTSGAGASVVDPFMGVGSVGLAALALGRRFLGVEIDPGYFAVAQRRIEEARSEGPLFARQAELFAGEVTG